MIEPILNQATLMAQLDKVIEPCSLSMGSPMSICDMGLVEEVVFEQGVVRVVLCLTDPACVNYGKIRQFITDVLMELSAVASVEVTHTTQVLWTPDRVKPAAVTKPIRVVPR